MKAIKNTIYRIIEYLYTFLETRNPCKKCIVQAACTKQTGTSCDAYFNYRYSKMIRQDFYNDMKHTGRYISKRIPIWFQKVCEGIAVIVFFFGWTYLICISLKALIDAYIRS